MTRTPVTLIFLLALVSCSRQGEELSYSVASTRPHDTQCYTQGLEFDGGRLFESGGGYGVSTIREVDPKTGDVLRRRPMARHVFAEGITILNNELFVLTWKEKTVYVFEPDTFRPIRQHTYEGEGWGLTHNGKELIMSNGSSSLRFLDPKTFAVTRTLMVVDGSKEIDQLNELEHVNGVVFANIYLSDRVARIDAATGKVTGWLDLSGLRKQLPRPNNAEVLNGIARDPATGRFLVTGKLWSRMFEIDIAEK
jgi:glutaminyl-peptide cyclotransferase